MVNQKNKKVRSFLYAYSALDRAGGVITGIAVPKFEIAIEHRCSNLIGNHSTKVWLRGITETKTKTGIIFKEGLVPAATLDGDGFWLEKISIDSECFMKMRNAVEIAEEKQDFGYLKFVANLIDFLAQAFLSCELIPVDYSALSKDTELHAIGWSDYSGR